PSPSGGIRLAARSLAYDKWQMRRTRDESATWQYCLDGGSRIERSVRAGAAGRWNMAHDPRRFLVLCVGRAAPTGNRRFTGTTPKGCALALRTASDACAAVVALGIGTRLVANRGTG